MNGMHLLPGFLLTLALSTIACTATAQEPYP